MQAKSWLCCGPAAMEPGERLDFRPWLFFFGSFSLWADAVKSAENYFPSVVLEHGDMSLVSVTQAVSALYGPCRQKMAGVRRGCKAHDSATVILTVVHAGDDSPVHDWDDISLLVKKL